MPVSARADCPLLAMKRLRSGRTRRALLICDGGQLQAEAMMADVQEIP